MATNAKTKSSKQDYPILVPFRLNGQWHPLEEKTIALSKKQAEFLLLSGKIDKPGTDPTADKPSTQKESK